MNIADILRPFVDTIKTDASKGNRQAKQIIDLYRLHCTCPNDPAAQALCEAVFRDWQQTKDTETHG